MGRSSTYSILFILSFFFFPPTVFAQGKEVVRIGVYSQPPKIYLDSEGKAAGIAVELIEEIAEKEGFETSYIPGEWRELKQLLEQGKIDVLPYLRASEVKDPAFTVNSIPVLSSWFEAYALRGARYHSVRDLSNIKIGIVEGAMPRDYIPEYFENSPSLAYNLKGFPGYPEAIEALKDGKIDLLVASRFFHFSEHFSEELSPTGIIFRPTDLYFAFPKNVDPDLVNLFDRHLANMKNDPNSEYYKILYSRFDPVIGNIGPTKFLWVLAVMLMLLLIVLVFTFLLKYQVDMKTKALWRRNRQLTRAKEKAEENERLKTIFLQNMSHEIRTPMNGIIGFLSLLKEPNLDPESRQKYIDIVNKSGKRLLTTINNIIEISKIDSRQIEVRPTEVDLYEIMNFYYNFFLPQAKEKKLEIILKNNIPQEKAFVVTDKFILDNILTNLINNALKFTNQGLIEIGTSIENDMVKFYVRDTGIGIPEDRKNAVFERFVQANLNMTRAHEGSGLGLAIVKAYVEILKGNIWLESEDGKGSTFYFTIPYVPAEAPAKPEESETLPEHLKDQQLKILIAEDDNISYLFIHQLLNLPNITLLRAKDGKQVISLAQENPDLTLILMDIKMPLVNGIDATRKIREFNPHVPIIAQSAYTFSGEMEKALEAGCNDYITKPISKNRLLNLVQKHSGKLPPEA